MIITSLAKLVTAIAFEAIDYWFESSKMFVLYILYIQQWFKKGKLKKNFFYFFIFF